LQFGLQHLKHAIHIRQNVVVPDADNAITKACKVLVAPAVAAIIRMLSTINFDYQPLLATDEIDVIVSD